MSAPCDSPPSVWLPHLCPIFVDQYPINDEDGQFNRNWPALRQDLFSYHNQIDQRSQGFGVAILINCETRSVASQVYAGSTEHLMLWSRAVSSLKTCRAGIIDGREDKLGRSAAESGKSIRDNTISSGRTATHH